MREVVQSHDDKIFAMFNKQIFNDVTIDIQETILRLNKLSNYISVKEVIQLGLENENQLMNCFFKLRLQDSDTEIKSQEIIDKKGEFIEGVNP